MKKWGKTRTRGERERQFTITEDGETSGSGNLERERTRNSMHERKMWDGKNGMTHKRQAKGREC